MKKMIFLKLFLLFTFFALCIVLITVTCFFPETSRESQLNHISFCGAVSVDGVDEQPLENGIPNNFHQIVLRGYFVEPIPIHEKILIRTENIGVQIKVNGTEEYSFFQEGNFPDIFHSPGYAWTEFSSPGIDAEDNIEIVITCYYGDSTQSVNALLESLSYGDRIHLYYSLFEKVGLIGLILLVATIAGLVYLIEGLLTLSQKIEDGKRIILFGFYCIAGGLWSLPDVIYPFFSLLVSPPWLAGVLDIIGIIIFPIAFSFLIQFFIKGSKTKKVMWAISFSTLLQAIIILLLQLFGIFDLYQMQSVIGVLAIIQLTCSIVCITSDLHQFKDKSLLFSLFAALPVFIAIMIEFANLFSDFMPKRILMIHAIAISFIILLYQFISYAKQQKEIQVKIKNMDKDLSEMKIAVVVGQMQPHFLYNTLASIRALCSIDTDKARDAIDKFSQYLRTNMDTFTKNQNIPFSEELEHLNNYVFMEKLRFGKKLNIVYDLETLDFYCPPLLVQPLVENAIRHGVMKRKEGGTVTISTYVKENKIILKVCDDGVGFDCSIIEKTECMGINNTINRLNLMAKGSLEIKSDENGTNIIIEIPKGNL